MRPEPCTCPKCYPGQLPLIEVVDLPREHLLYFGRYARSVFQVSPPTKNAITLASGAGVFCNGSTAPTKGRSIEGNEK